MISHPTVESLLEKHGNTPAGRKKARDQIAEAVRSRGKALIDEGLRSAGRSMKCGGTYGEPRHAGGWDGCANDGESCICDCHDLAVS